MTKFPYAWPSNLPIEFRYPIPGDENAGSPTKPDTEEGSDIVPGQTTWYAFHINDGGREKPIGDQHDDVDGSEFSVNTQLDQREIETDVEPIFPPGLSCCCTAPSKLRCISIQIED